jgi:hypothetical protein
MSREALVLAAQLPRSREQALAALAFARELVDKFLCEGDKRWLHNLIVAGLASARTEVMRTGGQTIEVLRVKITPEGRRALQGQRLTN